jgi:hypothetical protein
MTPALPSHDNRTVGYSLLSYIVNASGVDDGKKVRLPILYQIKSLDTCPTRLLYAIRSAID